MTPDGSDAPDRGPVFGRGPPPGMPARSGEPDPAPEQGADLAGGLRSAAEQALIQQNDRLHRRVLDLIRSQRDLGDPLDSSDVPAVLVGPDLAIRRFSEPAQSALGLQPSDVGRSLAELPAGHALGDLAVLVRDVLARDEILTREAHDRAGRRVLLRIAPHRGGGDAAEGALIELIDSDPVLRGGLEIEHQTALLRRQAMLIEMSHDAIIVRDAAHRVLFWNHGAQEIYGFSSEEALGQTLNVLLRTRGDVWHRLNDALKADGSWEGELRQKRRDGREIIVHSREVFIREAAGETMDTTILSIKRDVTENKRVLAALRHADRQKDQFLATLSHELRNPIAPIRNAVELLRMAPTDAPTIDHVREVLDRQVQQLTVIVEDLIDVSRILERKVKLRFERVALKRIVDDAVESAHSLIESARHHLSVSLPLEPIELEADGVRLRQVLVNLLNNAAKFTPAGGRIWLTAELQESEPGRSEVVLRVRDTGVGLPDDARTRIFEMFEQLGSSTQHQGTLGLGVGLTLVRSLVQMHGGSVEARSAGAGQGSEFVVRLPTTHALAPEANHKAGEAGLLKGGSAPKRKVLVIDDNRDQAESLGKLLSIMGHEVRLGYDGEEALRIALDFRPDVALLDLGLPKLNGCEVAKRMRSDPRVKDTLLLAQTGWGQEGDRQRTKEAGFDHHLLKPVDLVELKEILAQPLPAKEPPR
jgi:PAS domain S-box-containing protein